MTDAKKALATSCNFLTVVKRNMDASLLTHADSLTLNFANNFKKFIALAAYLNKRAGLFININKCWHGHYLRILKNFNLNNAVLTIG